MLFGWIDLRELALDLGWTSLRPREWLVEPAAGNLSISAASGEEGEGEASALLALTPIGYFLGLAHCQALPASMHCKVHQPLTPRSEATQNESPNVSPAAWARR